MFILRNSLGLGLYYSIYETCMIVTGHRNKELAGYGFIRMEIGFAA